MDAAIAVTATLLVTVIALRRWRMGPVPPRRVAPPGAVAERVRRTLTAAEIAARVGVALVALAGIVLLTRRLFG
jgi:hypothetical protein